MDIKEICKLRIIRGVNKETPMLIPSLSSKGFTDIKTIHQRVKEQLVDVSLVSAYDLYHDNINILDIYSSDLVFVDSGGYERSRDLELSEIYGVEHVPELWSRELYESQLNKLQELTSIVIVSFDPEGNLSTADQIKNAELLSRKYPQFSLDFLYKPTDSTLRMLDIDDYIKNGAKLSGFEVLGFTEKELGHSILERCQNILKIRKALNDINNDSPIHIFGCIDPLTSLAYFLSGADLFDGLSWLRFSFFNDIAYYRNNYALSSGNWSLRDERIRLLSYAFNLQVLTQLMTNMRQFTRDYNFDVFRLQADHLDKIKALLGNAGVTF